MKIQQPTLNNIDSIAMTVLSVRTVAQDVLEYEFEIVGDGNFPNWEPGSHIDILLKNGMTRQYSLMEGLQDPKNWRIAVLIEKNGRGGSSAIQKEFQVGTKVFARGPRNHFPIEPAEEYLFIAGGIGITPLIKMIELAERKGIPWELAYLGRSTRSMSYLSDLKESYGDKVKVFAKSQGKQFNVPFEISKLNPNTHVYCCGPERLILAIEDEQGVTNISRFHTERFHPRELIIDEPDHEFVVFCKKSDEEIIVPADESILMAADFAGIDIPGDCMEGTCGACETRVFEGEVDHRDSVLSAQARAEGDTMMICISRAKGKRLVIDL